MAKRKWTYEEVDEFRRTHHQYLFYFNREDANFTVPKALGFGRTNNWAHPISWVILLALLIFIVYNAFIK